MKANKLLLRFLLTICTIPTILTVSSCTTEGLEFQLSSNGDSVEVKTYHGSSVKVIIPSKHSGYSVTRIGNKAFFNCDLVQSIKIPNSVTSIGHETFFGCSSLTNINIPNSVTYIGMSAFSRCKSLRKIKIPNNVEKVEQGAFYECVSLENITIGNSVTSIENGTFFGCTSLTSITIPVSVTNIDNTAFYFCSSLTTVYYTGTKEQWEQINLGNDSDYLKNVNIIYNYKG